MNQDRRSRLVDEATAVEMIADGMTVAIGEPAPMALVRGIVRHRCRDLTVIATGLPLDLLVAAGCVRKTISYYAGGGVGVPVAPSFRRAAERGDIDVWECDEGILTSGLEAAGKALPFLPWRGGVGTSLPEVNPDLRVFRDPVAGQTLLAVPAIRPDVALLHAARADVHGNVQHHGGPGWIDLFLARAADCTIVQVDEIIANETVRRDPWATTLAPADAVVRLPWGAHPFYSRGRYVTDTGFIANYFALSATPVDVQGEPVLERFIDTYCREPADHVAYLERVGLRQLLGLHEY